MTQNDECVIARKKMLMTSPCLVIIIGILTICFIFGFFLIYKGIKLWKIFSANNNAGDFCLKYDGSKNEILAYAVDGQVLHFPADAEKSLSYAHNEGKLVLLLKNPTEQKWDLGFCFYAEYKKAKDSGLF